MRARSLLRHARACILVAAVVGCGKDDPTEPTKVTPPTPNFIRLESDAGDYIGGGRTYEYTNENAIIRLGDFGGRLGIQIEGDEWWGGDFRGPDTQHRITKGTYTGLSRFPFHNPAAGGMSWSGDGRGCNTLTGSFTVDSVTYAGDTLKAVDVRFEQHCEGAAPALRGTIHWRADDTTHAPGPISPPPAGLWQPPAGATPATGDYVYLESDAGDYIGGGVTRLLTEPTSVIGARWSYGHVTIDAGPWSGHFQAMNGIPELRPGYYGDLQRWPFHNPMKGGLSWSGDGRGCNTLTGWFVVDQVSYASGALRSIVLRFEQHCEGGTAALRGKIRWSA